MIEEVAACRYTSAQHLAAQWSGPSLMLAVSLCSPHRVLEVHSACYDFLHVMVGGAIAKLCVCVHLVIHQGSRSPVHFQKLQHDAEPCKEEKS